MPSRRKVIKGARWLLLRNRENVEAKDRVRLRDLLHANRRLATVYILKDDLKHLWAYTYVGAAERFFTEWYQRAIRSRIEPLKTFAPSQSARERDPSALSLPTAHQPTRRHQQRARTNLARPAGAIPAPARASHPPGTESWAHGGNDMS